LIRAQLLPTRRRFRLLHASLSNQAQRGLRRLLLSTSLLVFTLGSTLARAQSDALVTAVRLDRPNALELAESELASCSAVQCASIRQLSLLGGYLRLSAGNTSGALELLRRTSPPPPLEPFFAYYLGQAQFYSGELTAAVASFQTAFAAAPPSLQPRVRARLGETLLLVGDAVQALPHLEQAAPEPPAA
jgi:soluble lytic murein transglycosylase